MDSAKRPALLGSLLIILGLPALGRAATFNVNSNADAGDLTPGNGICATAGSVCTLRAAIEEANALAGADTINVPAMTIVLGAPLLVTQSVTVGGAGQGLTIVDGNDAVQVFNFQVGGGTHTVSNLTVRNASTASNGGGIFNQATLTLVNVTLSDNSARQGGGIFNASSLTLQNVLFSGNVATTAVFGEGGGALNNASALSGTGVTIISSVATQGAGFYNNSAAPATLTAFNISNNTAKYGAGVDNDFGNVSLTNGRISGNIAECCDPSSGGATGGGGIYHNEGTMNLTDVVLSGNQATSPGGYGGAIFSFENMSLLRVSIFGNRATYGAGIYNGNFAGTPNSLTATNVTLSANIGTSSVSPFIEAVGAGLYNTSNGQALLTNATVAFNSAVVSGGIENLPSGTNNNVTIRNSIVASNAGPSGSPDCRGAIGSGGSNIVGNTSGCTFVAAGGDQTGVSPNLDPLMGSPPVHPLRFDSPAFQTGSNAFCPATDQRGLPRPQGVTCDKGAYEIGDVPVVGDWDGNLIVTGGFFRPWERFWYLRNTNSAGPTDLLIGYGAFGDIPVVGDWNGDGIKTVGIWRRSNHAFYLRNSNTSGKHDILAFYGIDGDIPVVGDWDGDGIDTIGIYRPFNQRFFLRNSNTTGNHDILAIYGAAGDIPVVGDWNGDGVDTIGVWRPSERAWYLRDFNSTGPNTIPAILYGIPNDVPIVGDWDGNGTATVGVYRPSNRTWFLRNSNTSGNHDITFIH